MKGETWLYITLDFKTRNRSSPTSAITFRAFVTMKETEILVQQLQLFYYYKTILATWFQITAVYLSAYCKLGLFFVITSPQSIYHSKSEKGKFITKYGNYCKSVHSNSKAPHCCNCFSINVMSKCMFRHIIFFMSNLFLGQDGWGLFAIPIIYREVYIFGQ